MALWWVSRGGQGGLYLRGRGTRATACVEVRVLTGLGVSVAIDGGGGSVVNVVAVVLIAAIGVDVVPSAFGPDAILILS